MNETGIPPKPVIDPKALSIRFSLNGILRGCRGLAPVAIFAMPFGMAFAVAALEAGMPALQTLIVSATVFAGASLFAMLELWEAPLPYLSIALVVLAVNARHMILGAALAQWINALRWKERLPTIFFLSDLNFADSNARFKEGENDVGVLLGGGILLWIAWMAGVCVGLILGTAVGDMARYGLDVVMGCFFTATLIGQVCKENQYILPVAIAAITAIATADLVPTGWNIILGALAGGLVGAFRHAD